VIKNTIIEEVGIIDREDDKVNLTEINKNKVETIRIYEDEADNL
jgi:hypothetical protein